MQATHFSFSKSGDLLDYTCAESYLEVKREEVQEIFYPNTSVVEPILANNACTHMGGGS